eukprot:1182818-Rhodomonas_salina.8
MNASEALQQHELAAKGRLLRGKPLPRCMHWPDGGISSCRAVTAFRLVSQWSGKTRSRRRSACTHSKTCGPCCHHTKPFSATMVVTVNGTRSEGANSEQHCATSTLNATLRHEPQVEPASSSRLEGGCPRVPPVSRRTQFLNLLSRNQIRYKNIIPLSVHFVYSFSCLCFDLAL